MKLRNGVPIRKEIRAILDGLHPSGFAVTISKSYGTKEGPHYMKWQRSCLNDVVLEFAGILDNEGIDTFGYRQYTGTDGLTGSISLKPKQ